MYTYIHTQAYTVVLYMVGTALPACPYDTEHNCKREGEWGEANTNGKGNGME